MDKQFVCEILKWIRMVCYNNYTLFSSCVHNILPFCPFSFSQGKLINTRGCVVRVGRTKQLAQWFVFACSKCGLEKIEKQSEGLYTVPKKCTVCGVSTFQPVLNSPYVRTISFQMIRIQEILNNEQVYLLLPNISIISSPFAYIMILKAVIVEYFLSFRRMGTLFFL